MTKICLVHCDGVEVAQIRVAALRIGVAKLAETAIYSGESVLPVDIDTEVKPGVRFSPEVAELVTGSSEVVVTTASGARIVSIMTPQAVSKQEARKWNLSPLDGWFISEKVKLYRQARA